MATAPKTTPKAPQDRKKKAAELVVDVTKTPGWDLMVPMEHIPVWDQTTLIAMLQDAVDHGEEGEDGSTSFDISVIGTIAKALQEYAVDRDAYLKFVSGPGALERAMTLAMAWVGQMGEFKGSES